MVVYIDRTRAADAAVEFFPSAGGGLGWPVCGVCGIVASCHRLWSALCLAVLSLILERNWNFTAQILTQPER